MKVKELIKALQECDETASVELRTGYFEDESDHSVGWIGVIDESSGLGGTVLLAEEGPSGLIRPIYADGKLVEGLK